MYYNKNIKMESNGPYQVKSTFPTIEEQNADKIENLKHNNIEFILKMLDIIIASRKDENYFSEDVDLSIKRETDLTTCLSHIHKVLSLMHKDVKIIKETHL